MARKRALIIPVVCPINEYVATPTSIYDHTVYHEVKYGFMYEGGIGRRRRVRIGSFGVLYSGFEGHTSVFLHPYEVFTVLKGEVVKVSEDVSILGFKDLGSVLGSGSKFSDFISELWYSSKVLMFSSYIAEAVVGNLSIKYVRGSIHEARYCYGRVERVVRRLNVDEVVDNSKLIALPRKLGEPMEKAEMVYEFLFYYPTRWPWMNYGLLIDRSRRWITVLNPDTADSVLIDDLEELRVMEYGEARVPLIIARKLTFTTISPCKIIQELVTRGTSKLHRTLGYLLNNVINEVILSRRRMLSNDV